ncbi:hypothetical protein B0H10DRAFT_2428444 [Mycena sp. CBHHK59/15]|nr:hypothetical protein B0H10DRAFT_2428444 [Mycena sp. CBHHK59/15]
MEPADDWTWNLPSRPFNRVFSRTPTTSHIPASLLPYTMRSYTLALLVLLSWSATAAYAYPASATNPESFAPVAAKSEKPVTPMSMPYPVTNTAERDPNARPVPRSLDSDTTTFKRQIHNADYHANAPPPSPNPAPAPAQEAPAAHPSPASPPPAAAAAPEPGTKDKRFGPGLDERDAGRAKVVMLRSNKPAIDVGGESADATYPGTRNVGPRVPTNIEGECFGVHRRDVEARTNVNNPNFDHDTFARWSRDEVEKMQAWSKLNHDS